MTITVGIAPTLSDAITVVKKVMVPAITGTPVPPKVGQIWPRSDKSTAG